MSPQIKNVLLAVGTGVAAMFVYEFLKSKIAKKSSATATSNYEGE
jgi:hypothetical protein